MELAKYWYTFSANDYDLMPIVVGLDEVTLIDLLGVNSKDTNAYSFRKRKKLYYHKFVFGFVSIVY